MKKNNLLRIIAAVVASSIFLTGCGTKTLEEKMDSETRAQLSITCEKYRMASGKLFEEVNCDVTENTISLNYYFREDASGYWSETSDQMNAEMKDTYVQLAQEMKEAYRIKEQVEIDLLFYNNDDSLLDTFVYCSE